MNTKDIQNIIDILKNSDVTEFKLEQDGTTISISRNKNEIQYIQPQALIPTQPQTISIQEVNTSSAMTQVVADKSVSSVDDSNLIKVESPIVGTFYRKSSPDTPPFVEVGTKVKKGQVLCIVEAMKLMNEIESPSDGVIEKILLEDSQIVEFGEVLFLIKP